MAGNGLIFSLYVGQFILNAANSSIAPFFPQKAKLFGVDETLIGLIFSVHPVGNFICSLILGQMLSKGENRKPATILGIFLTGIGVLGFALVDLVSSTWSFILITIVSRLILGIGQSLFSTPAYAYIPLLYKSTFEEKCGWMESSCGVGLMIGPLLGSILIQLGSYTTPFIFFGAFSFALIPLFVYYVPKAINVESPKNRISLDSADSSGLLEGHREIEAEEFEVNYLRIFSDKYITLNYIAIFLPSCGLLFLDPTMGIYFEEVYSLDDFYVGLVFSVGTAVYLLASPFATKLLKYSKNYEAMLFSGSLLTGVSFFFLGPDPLTALPTKLIVTCVANGVIGLASILIYIPALPQLYKLLVRLYPEENEEIIGDISSALYNTSYAVGEFIGPLLGGVLAQYCSFPRGASIFGASIIAFSLIYVIFAGVCCNKAQIGIIAQKKIEEFPISLSPSLQRINSNKIKTKQPTIPGLMVMSSPLSVHVPKFYTPVLRRADQHGGEGHFVFKKNKESKNHKKSHLKNQFVSPRSNSKKYRQEDITIPAVVAAAAAGIVKGSQDEDNDGGNFSFVPYSETDLSKADQINFARDSIDQRPGNHLFKKTGSQIVQSPK